MSLENRIREIAEKNGVSPATPGFALAVSNGQGVVYQGAFGLADLEAGRPIKPTDNFVIASNTKQMCCLCMLILGERGLVDLDAPVRRYFPDFPDYVDRITPMQMMGHTSGVRDYFEDDATGELLPDVAALASADAAEVLGYVKTLGDLEFEPDCGWSYSNSTYVMLGDIVRQATGMGFGRFLETEVFAPLGMARSFAPDDLVSRDEWLVNGYGRTDSGYVCRPYDMLMVGFADGNVSSNVADMLAWHRWLFDGVGPELVSPSTKARLFEDRVLADGRRTGYGLGLFLGEKDGACGRIPHLPGVPEVWHTGSASGFVSVASRFVDDGTSIVMLANDEGVLRGGIFTEVCRAVLLDQ